MQKNDAKKAIATITFHAPNNNGSFLQAYALQKVLTERFGYDNLIIDFRTKKQIYQYSVFRPVRSVNDAAKNMISLLHYRKLKEHNKRFEYMRTHYLKMTERCLEEEEAMRLAESFDIAIAGSDQIWNTGAPDFSRAYLLPCKTPKKIAYAVSMGSFSAESEMSQFSELLMEFSNISVRDESCRKNLEKQIGRPISVTLDPTLLLEAKDYAALSSNERIEKEPYIFFYSINFTPQVMRIVKKISRQTGLRVVTVFTSFHTVSCEKYGFKVLYDAGPSEFLSLIRNAKYVLTNSFHGMAFSIIFNKNYYCLGITSNGTLIHDDRIDGLLGELGLDSRYIGIHTIPNELLPIEWDKVETRLKSLRRSSLCQLNDALG